MSGESSCYKASYFISYMKTYSEDERRKSLVVRGLKSAVRLLTGVPLLSPAVDKTADTLCNLTIIIVGIKDNCLKLRYDISVSNGSLIHKKIVKEYELVALASLIKNVSGVAYEDPYLVVDLKRVGIKEVESKRVAEASFEGNDCVFMYE